MSFLNKKILAAAIVGSLFAGSAFAAPLNVTRQYYAQEIVFPAGGLVPTAAPAITWASGYNYSANEVKYVRVVLTGATFLAGMPAPTVVGGTVGAVNGLGTNVLTFSVTSTAPITSASTFNLNLSAAGVGYINIPQAGDVSIQVSLYDQASQAQAGGPTGLLTVGSYDNTTVMSFARSYAFTNSANTLTAEVAATAPTVRYGNFVPNAATTPATTTVAGTLNNNLAIRLVDPDGATGPQSATFKADGTPIALADLFAPASTIAVEGDFSASTVAAGGVTLGGVLATPAPTGATPRYPNRLTWAADLSAPAVDVPLVYGVTGNRAIAAGSYTATFNPVAASSAYSVASLTANTVGAIRRNGVELQAPLAQVPPAWTSRLVLTNTGTASPAYSISVLGETGQTITTAATTGVVNPGTTVIDLKDVMTGFSDTQRRRGTVVVSVEAADSVGSGTIQGLYQIVNAATGSISNHVLVRPGTN